MKRLEVRGYVKSINDFVYNPIVDFNKGKFDTGLRETNGRATGIVYEDIEFLDLCTGLKDMLGNKIYKGDIIEEVYLTKYKPSKVIRGKIIYNKDAFEIEWLTKDHFNNNILYVRNDNIQIIGNIHQNKDLLEQS